MGTWAPLGVAALIVAAAAGCGDGPDAGLPSYSVGSATGTPAASATAPPATPTPPVTPSLAPDGARLGDPENPIVVGHAVRGDAAQEAVQRAYLAFWVERTASLRRVSVDREALAAVATGSAARGVVRSVTDLRSRRRHTEGGSTVNVRTVTVTGAAAALTDCFEDGSVDYGANGTPAEEPAPTRLPFLAHLTATGPTWRVTQMSPTKLDDCGGSS